MPGAYAPQGTRAPVQYRLRRQQDILIRSAAVTDARLRLETVRLPALPEVLLKLLALYRRDDATLLEFVDVIETDAAITARLLEVANSAAYGGCGAVRDLKRCLNVVGIETVRTVVISQAVYQTMHSVPELSRVDLTPYWQHTLLVGAIAREVSRHHEGLSPDEAYLAGLLHDIGRLGLLVAEPGFYAAAMAGDEELPSPEVERQWLKVDHAEAGAWLIERWRLGREIADSARYHHQAPQRLADADLLIRIVAFANLMAHDDPDPKAVIDAGGLCGLRLGQISEVASKARARVQTAADQLGVKLDRVAAPRNAPSAVDQLRSEVEPLLVASTLLSELPERHDDLQRRLDDLAAAARIVFPFRDVIVLRSDAERRLRRDGGEGDWAHYALPAGGGTRAGVALASGQPVFLERKPAGAIADELSIAEDQLLRLLDSDQVVLLPVERDAHESAGCRAGRIRRCGADLHAARAQRLDRGVLRPCDRARSAIGTAAGCGRSGARRADRPAQRCHA